jgi:hypothetical protein
MRGSNNTTGGGMVMLVGFSVLLSLTALIAVAAHWPDRSGTRMVTVMRSAPHMAVAAPVAGLNVVMKDPGCHWFQTDGGLKTVASVKGPVNLTNMDEAALKIVGPSGTVIDHVGKAVRLSAGKYAITMVGQAADDNHLKLTVS